MKKPPLIPTFLLSHFVPVSIRESFLGDLEEQFHKLVSDEGLQNANHWFWTQMIVSGIPLLRLWIRNNFELSPIRIFLVIAVLLPIALSEPLTDSTLIFYLIELFALLWTAFALGFLASTIFRSSRLLISISFCLIIFTITLMIRGEWYDIPWMLTFSYITISSGAGLSRLWMSRYSARS